MKLRTFLGLNVVALASALCGCTMDKTADDPVTKLSRIEYTYTDVISTIEERLLIEPDGHLKIEFFVGGDGVTQPAAARA